MSLHIIVRVTSKTDFFSLISLDFVNITGTDIFKMKMYSEMNIYVEIQFWMRFCEMTTWETSHCVRSMVHLACDCASNTIRRCYWMRAHEPCQSCRTFSLFISQHLQSLDLETADGRYLLPFLLICGDIVHKSV